MKDYPLLCNDEMVRAIMAGLQTQTRRPVKYRDKTMTYSGVDDGETGKPWPYEMNRFGDWISQVGPFGVPGDRLRVRECWKHSLTKYHDTGNPDDHGGPNDPCYGYRATMTYGCGKPIPQPASNHIWRPNTNMPREACRTFLPVTAVRVERVQDITEADARAEGIIDGGCLNCGESEPCECDDPQPNARDTFISLWNAIYGTWSDNPWIWVGTFRTPKQQE